jgi:hypothetical protein
VGVLIRQRHRVALPTVGVVLGAFAVYAIATLDDIIRKGILAGLLAERREGVSSTASAHGHRPTMNGGTTTVGLGNPRAAVGGRRGISGSR